MVGPVFGAIRSVAERSPRAGDGRSRDPCDDVSRHLEGDVGRDVVGPLRNRLDLAAGSRGPPILLHIEGRLIDDELGDPTMGAHRAAKRGAPVRQRAGIGPSDRIVLVDGVHHDAFVDLVVDEMVRRIQEQLVRDANRALRRAPSHALDGEERLANRCHHFTIADRRRRRPETKGPVDGGRSAPRPARSWRSSSCDIVGPARDAGSTVGS